MVLSCFRSTTLTEAWEASNEMKLLQAILSLGFMSREGRNSAKAKRQSELKRKRSSTGIFGWGKKKKCNNDREVAMFLVDRIPTALINQSSSLSEQESSGNQSRLSVEGLAKNDRVRRYDMATDDASIMDLTDSCESEHETNVDEEVHLERARIKKTIENVFLQHNLPPLNRESKRRTGSPLAFNITWPEITKIDHS